MTDKEKRMAIKIGELVCERDDLLHALKSISLGLFTTRNAKIVAKQAVEKYSKGE